MPGKTTMIAAVAIAAAALATPGSAQTSLKMTLFGQPSFNNDSIWLALERGLIGARRLVHPAQLPYELKSRRADFVVGCGWLEVEQGPNIPAHRVVPPRFRSLSHLARAIPSGRSVPQDCLNDNVPDCCR